MTTAHTLPFMSLTPGPDAADIDAAIRRVIDRGWFILGPEVAAFEEEFAAVSGARFAVGVNTGTDALALAMRALGIGPGDEVITTPLSAAYSALAILMTGATPVFVDIDPARLTLDPALIEDAIGPHTVAILPVHLYGQPADMPAIETIARDHDLTVIEDACQAHMATSNHRPVGTLGAAGAFSFYPTKNLGALGDAGAILTNDELLAQKLKRLRNGGQSDRYHHVEFGVNSRLDELQAAILRARLPFLPGWTARRRHLAARYRRGLSGAAVTVPPEFDAGHVYHLFPILTPHRASLQRHLDAHGIGTLVHYPIPIPRQPALAGVAAGPCPVADRIANEVCSLPLYPHLGDDDIDRVCEVIHAWRPES